MTKPVSRLHSASFSIAHEFSLPIDVVTQTIAIVAKRRAGKSYLAARFVEELFELHEQIVIIDPKGDWWGLRSSADGKHKGLPILILGGEHGDLPLEPGAGEIIARMVVEDRVSVLLDVGDLRKGQVTTFVTGFLETLYRLKAQDRFRTPLLLVIDEADAIAPQRPQHGEERMLGAAEDIVRRGGQRGIGCLLVTQRAAVLNKNVLTQAQILISLRTIAPQDLSAMNAWVDVHGTLSQRKTLMDSLPALPVGDAWVWSPGWPSERGIFERIHVSKRKTFDSGATPKSGEDRPTPKTLAEIDLGAIRKAMATTIEKAKADDPRLLRKQIAELDEKIAELEAELEMRPEAERIEISVLTDADRAYLGSIAATINRALSQTPATKSEEVGTVKARPKAESKVHQKTDLGSGERRVLIAVAQHHNGVTREQLTVLTGYKRSSRDTYLQRLRSVGYVRQSDRIFATDEGIEALGSDFVPLPSGAELRAHWIHRLPEGERRIFEILIKAYPKSVNREAVSDATGYKRSSRDTYVQRLRSRELVEIDDNGELRVSEELFE